MYRVILQSVAIAALTCFSLSTASSPAKAIEVYMFKGAGDFSFVNENMHFSRGLNKMSEQLNAEGIRSEVRRFGAMEKALKLIRKRKPRSIAIVGHSMGALASMSMARSLKADGIHIAYMALLDIPGPVGSAAKNAAWVENYYTINPVYAKLSNTRSHPKAKNIQIFGYLHNRLDDAPKVQNGILSAIREIHVAEQRELAPQPETLFVETQPAVRPAAPETTQQAYQPVTPVNPAPSSQPHALPSVAPQPYVDPVTTSSTAPSSVQVPQVDVGQARPRLKRQFLRKPERRRLKPSSFRNLDR